MRWGVVLWCVGCIEPPVVDGPQRVDTGARVVVQRKTVVARPLEPDVTLLVDRSGAATGRLDEVRAELERVVALRHTDYRFGLALTPAGTDCAGGSVVLPPGAGAQQVSARLRSLEAYGDAPSLAAALEEQPGKGADREAFVLLVTAGGSERCPGDAAEAARGLRSRQVFTAVVSLGPPSAVLDAVALAGGLQRACPGGSDSECDGSPCEPAARLCAAPTYRAPDAAALERALSALLPRRPQAADACRLTLEVTPAGADRVEVLLNGVRLKARHDWTLSGSAMTLVGAACERLRASTPQAPAWVEIRIDVGP